MKTHLKVISVCFCLIITFTVCSFVLAQEINSRIYSDKTNILVGDTFTVYCEIKSDGTLNDLDLTLDYNNKMAEYISGADTAYDSGVNIKRKTNEKSVCIPITFKSLCEGDTEFILGGDIITENSVDYAYGTCTISAFEDSSSIKTKANNGSTSATIYEIKVSGAVLLPSFNADITSYTAIVKYNVDKVTLSVDSNGGVVKGTGTFNVNVGDNKHSVTVTSGKSAKSYNINIRRMTREETEIYEKTLLLSNPLSADISNKTYLIEPDITGLGIFKGYTIEKTLRGDIEVTYLNDIKGKYKLYYLKDQSGKGKYFSQNPTGEFEDIPYIIRENNLYIVNEIPDNIELGDTYQKKDIIINGISVPSLSYKQKEAKDIYILYCYYNG